jgi:hypothetical protein
MTKGERRALAAIIQAFLAGLRPNQPTASSGKRKKENG